MSVLVVNLLTSLYGILTKKNAQKRFFTAVYVHRHEVAIKLLVNEPQRLLCKNKCLLDGWLMAAAVCLKGHKINQLKRFIRCLWWLQIGCALVSE